MELIFFHKLYNCNFQTTEPEFFYSGTRISFFCFLFGFIQGPGIFFKNIPAPVTYLMVASLVFSLYI